jgi:hypothetical protein
MTCRKSADFCLFRNGFQAFTGNGIKKRTLAQFIETVGRDLIKALGKTGETGLDGV